MALVVFDRGSFHAALDKKRHKAGLNWKQVAAQSGVAASTLTRLGQGKCPDADGLASLAHWGGLNLNRFIKESERV